ncbi:sensor histidine kinase, partial [Streptomyces sp. SID7982]|nr:sensor histidine kinase [Streptomyces sp. SID7982]
MSAQRRQFHNAALREPTSGIADVRCMGLAVVARLAERHGITVELRDSSDLGTIAEVGLPATVLAPAPVRTSTSWTVGRHRDVGARQEEAVPRTSPWRKRHDPAAPDERAGRSPAETGAGHGRTDEAVEDVPASHPVHDEPGPPDARVSPSGLPMRRRPHPQRGRENGGGQRPVAPAPKAAPRRRDSRQVSDVLTAYARGINRNTGHRDRPVTDDDTERNEK